MKNELTKENILYHACITQAIRIADTLVEIRNGLRSYDCETVSQLSTALAQ